MELHIYSYQHQPIPFELWYFQRSEAEQMCASCPLMREAVAVIQAQQRALEAKRRVFRSLWQ